MADSASKPNAVGVDPNEQAFGQGLFPLDRSDLGRSDNNRSNLTSAIVWVGTGERSLSIWLQWLFVIAVTAVLSASVGAAIALFDPLKPEKWGIEAPVDITNPSIKRSWDQGWQYRLTRPMNLAIIGVDHAEPGAPPHQQSLEGRSDTLLVARVNPREKMTTVLSVPRDTLADIPGHGRKRINQANALGGAALVTQTLRKNLNNLPIDRYIRINTVAFRELIDLLGGVEIFVPRPMEYRDRTQDLNIQLAAGWQTIAGDQAEQFVRYRGGGLGDIGRVQRQQMLLKALRQRLASPDIWLKLPSILQKIQHYIDTNLSWEELTALLGFGLRQSSDRWQFVLLPGRFGTAKDGDSGAWIADMNERSRLARELFQVNYKGPRRSSINSEATRDRFAFAYARIAIQNASGDPKAVDQVRTKLKRLGFRQVYTIDPWSDTLNHTQVIVQTGRQDVANLVKRRLGVGQLDQSSIGDLGSDLTLRLGRDWTNAVPPAPADPALTE